MRLEISVWLLAIFMFGGILWTSFLCWRGMKDPRDEQR